MQISRRLKEETLPYHKKMEAHPWVRLLFKNQLPMTFYYRYLQNLHKVYIALEAQLQLNGILDTYQSQLARVAKIDSDLNYFETNFQFSRSNLTSRYAQYLNSISQGESHRYIGHLYVRYFGDMLGGKMIGAKVSDNFKLSNQGIELYDFELFKLAYPNEVDELRAALDGIVLSNNQLDEIVFEAKMAFDLNFEMMTLCMQESI